MKTVQYGSRKAYVKSAAGVRGILCRSIDGDYFLRVTKSSGRFTDYYLRHSDLEITVGDAEAALYRIGTDHVLDHTPETLGLSKARTRIRRSRTSP